MTAEDLAQENAHLHQQLKLLVTTEKRLFRTQREVEAQLRRIRALNDFALSAPQSYSEAEILFQAIELLWAHFPVQVMIAYFVPNGASAPIAWVRSEADETVQVELPAPHHPMFALELLNSSELFEKPDPASPWAPLLSWLDRASEEVERQLRGQKLYRCVDVVMPFGAADVDSPHAVIAFRSSTVSNHDSPVTEADRPFLDLLCRHGASAMEMAALHGALERRIQQRTRELSEANEQLEASLKQQRQAQEQLIQAGKLAAMGTLVAGLSHELNNPIGIIIGFVQSLLKRTPEESPSRQALAAIERQAQRCGLLVRNLLDFARQEPGSRTSIQPVHLLEKVIELSASQARRRDLKLELAAGGRELPPLTVNVQELESALLNLVTNAIDATPAGGSILLTARAAEPGAAGGATGVELTVRDTGTGIPTELLSRIFDPFFTTKPPGQGTGLGLALTRQIVEAHGGAVTIDTAIDAGTTFHVVLPIGVAAAQRGAA